MPDRAVRYKETRSVVSDSTTDALAPTHEARRDRDVEHFPIQRRAAGRARRPQPATQLQHSNGEGEIHVDDLRLPVVLHAEASRRQGLHKTQSGSTPRILLTTNRRVESETSRILIAGKFYNVPGASKHQK